MQPDPEDRLSQEPARSGLPKWLIAIVAVLIIIGIWYVAREEKAPPPPPVTEQTTVPPAAPAEPPQPPASDIPSPPPPAPPPTEAEPVEPEQPPLTLEESDEVLRRELSAAGQSELLAGALKEDDLVERGTAMVDSLSRGLFVQKVLPVPRPSEKFAVSESAGTLTIAPGSYSRYDEYARAVGELEVTTLVDTFNQARPLLEEAYAGLGYQPDEFDNAVVRALDRILATPVVETPPEVVPKGGIYKFADPALEQLAPIQKLLLRMGPDNAAVIKEKARQLRTALLQQ